MGKVTSVLVSRNAAGVDAKVVAETAMEDLGDLPMWAIDKACMAYRRGEAGDGHLAQTPAEIRRYAKNFAPVASMTN